MLGSIDWALRSSAMGAVDRSPSASRDDVGVNGCGTTTMLVHDLSWHHAVEVAQQLQGNLAMPIGARNVQRRPAEFVARRDRSPGLEQAPRHILVVVGGRVIEGRAPLLVRSIDVGAVLEKGLNQSHMTIVGR